MIRRTKCLRTFNRIPLYKFLYQVTFSSLKNYNTVVKPSFFYDFRYSYFPFAVTRHFVLGIKKNIYTYTLLLPHRRKGALSYFLSRGSFLKIFIYIENGSNKNRFLKLLVNFLSYIYYANN